MSAKLESHKKIIEDEEMTADCSDNNAFISEDKEELL